MDTILRPNVCRVFIYIMHREIQTSVKISGWITMSNHQGNIPEAQLYADYAILACIYAYRKHGCVDRAAFGRFMSTLAFLNRMPK